MLQWMCQIKECVYFLIFSGNIPILWFIQGLYIFHDIFSELCPTYQGCRALNFALARLSCLYLMPETRCENGGIYNSRCYKIHREEKVNWFTAVNRCLSNNGNLAVFDDNIQTYFARTLLADGHLWIGLIKSWWTWPDAGLYSWQWHQQFMLRLYDS